MIKNILISDNLDNNIKYSVMVNYLFKFTMVRQNTG